MNKADKLLNIKISLLLFLSGLLVYLPSLNHGYTLDDAIVITQNTYTQSADIFNILSKDTFAGFFTEKESINLVEGGRYRPLSLVVFAVIWQITEQPWVYHLLNVLLYALTVVMLFLVFSHLLKQMRHKALIAAGTALVFAIHPVHTEVVNNIKSLDEILSLLLALSAWLLQIKTLGHKSKFIQQLMIILLFFLAMMAKETAVVFLPIVFLSCFVFHRANLLQSVVKIVPLIVGFLLYWSLRSLVLGDATTDLVSMEPMNNPFLKYVDSHWIAFSWTEKAGTIALVLGKYLMLLIWPINLTHDYYPQVIPMTPLNTFAAILPVIAYVLMLASCLYGLYKRSVWGFALAMYLIAVFLFSNIPLTIGTLMAERFLYVPSIGFALLMAWSIAQFIPENQTKQNLFKQPLLVSVVMVSVVLLGLATWKLIDRSKDWHDNFSLFQADIEVSSQSAKLQNALGAELTIQSQKPLIKGTAEEQSMLKQALLHLDQAIKLHPTYVMAYMLKGNAQHYMGQHELAIENYHQALTLYPEYQVAKQNLQMVEDLLTQEKINQQIIETEQRAFQAIEQNNHHLAVELFSQILKLQNNSKFHFMRGVAYANLSQFHDALDDFVQAEALDDQTDKQNTMRIWQALKNTHVNLGQQDLAETYQRKIDGINN
jgi:Flp pilus assembly protein TadD